MRGRSPKRAPEEKRERMFGLFRDKYADFTVKHFHEQLQKRHNYGPGYTVTKLALHTAGLVRKAPKRAAHRKKRPCRPFRGMKTHLDVSRHAWIEGLPPMDLIPDQVSGTTLDDATSEIYSMFLVAAEGTASTLQALREVINENGLFCSLYTDRGSHYFYTPKAGEKVSKAHVTQVGRALSHPGIEQIAACSPEARGRSERMFGTLQGRLPKDLQLAGITMVEAANGWLKAHYIAEHSAEFAIKAEQEGTAFVADTHQAWREALCVIDDRTVANDNTIAWNGRRLQLPENRLRPHFVKAVVRIHEYPHGTTRLFLGPHRLATFTADGQQNNPNAPQSGGVLGAVKMLLDGQMLLDGGAVRVPCCGRSIQWSPAMTTPKLSQNDLCLCLTQLDMDATLIAVIEMGQKSWLVAGIVSGVERQPVKKLSVDAHTLL